jgi:hypothetical protein
MHRARLFSIARSRGEICGWLARLLLRQSALTAFASCLSIASASVKAIGPAIIRAGWGDAGISPTATIDRPADPRFSSHAVASRAPALVMLGRTPSFSLAPRLLQEP